MGLFQGIKQERQKYDNSAIKIIEEYTEDGISSDESEDLKGISTKDFAPPSFSKSSRQGSWQVISPSTNSIAPAPNINVFEKSKRARQIHRGFLKVCSFCTRAFRTEEDKNEHYGKVHGLNLRLTKPFVCPAPGCATAFPIAGRFTRHIRTAHDPSVEMQLLRKSLKEDMEIEGGSKSGESEEIPKKDLRAQAFSKAYKSHWQVISPSTNSIAPAPNINVFEKSKRARQVHRKFLKVCSFCTRAFRTEGDKNEHYGKVHGLDLNLEKPFFCPAPGCATAFPIAGWLTRHIRTAHDPGVEMQLLRKSLKEDMEIEGSGKNQIMEEDQEIFSQENLHNSKEPKAKVTNFVPTKCKSINKIENGPSSSRTFEIPANNKESSSKPKVYKCLLGCTEIFLTLGSLGRHLIWHEQANEEKVGKEEGQRTIDLQSAEKKNSDEKLNEIPKFKKDLRGNISEYIPTTKKFPWTPPKRSKILGAQISAEDAINDLFM